MQYAVSLALALKSAALLIGCLCVLCLLGVMAMTTVVAKMYGEGDGSGLLYLSTLMLMFVGIVNIRIGIGNWKLEIGNWGIGIGNQ